LASEPSSSPTPSGRLAALDLFRGATVAAMLFVNNPGSWAHVLPPFDHAAWNGCTPTDLVFPFFLFIVGTASVLSLGKRAAQGASRLDLARHAARRGATIVLVGWALAAFPFNLQRLLHLRIPGVLPRIGVVYALGALLLLAAPRRRTALFLAGASAALLVLHTALLFLPGYDLTREGNLQTAIDVALLKGHLWKPAWDPEGILSTLTALATMLTGALAGILLTSKAPLRSRLAALGAAGAAGIAAGLAWQAAGLPLNKGLWTGSYVLFASGAACLSILLALVVVDVLGVKRPFAPLFTFGTNPLLAFVLSGLLAKVMGLVKWTGEDGKAISVTRWLFENVFSRVGEPYAASHLQALAVLAVVWAVLRYCERRGWYWKV
jgi:predicted acyltransferase